MCTVLHCAHARKRASAHSAAVGARVVCACVPQVCAKVSRQWDTQTQHSQGMLGASLVCPAPAPAAVSTVQHRPSFFYPRRSDVVAFPCCFCPVFSLLLPFSPRCCRVVCCCRCPLSLPCCFCSCHRCRRRRFKNSRFDVIGGAIYFLSIVSILPRCNAGLALLASTSLWDFGAVFFQEFLACWYSLFMESQLSLFMACAFFLLCLGFAKGGGVGAVSGERQEQQQAQAQRARSQQRAQRQGSAGAGNAPAGAGAGAAAPAAAAGAAVKGSTSSSKQKRRSPVVGPLVKLRTGGTSNQLLVAMLHTGAHLSLAIVLLLLLELGVEICIK